MDLEQKFRIIERRFKEHDAAIKHAHGKPFFDTTHGIWGASSMLDVFELFLKIRLDEKSGFADLGSGDGRIALIAGLFTQATGIEADTKLHETAITIRAELILQIPELERCSLINADYTKEDLAKFSILFTFADHVWDEQFEQKLQSECKGILLSYNRIFLPKKLAKGKTYWIQQLPIISYPLNIEEKDLFGREPEQ